MTNETSTTTLSQGTTMTEPETPTTTDLMATNPAPVLQDGTGRKPGTFVPGDKRINRKGRPKSFAQLRERVLTFLSEKDDEASGTRLDAILRELAANDPKTLLEYGFGKPSAADVTAIGAPQMVIVQCSFDPKLVTGSDPVNVTPPTVG
jgi:hypothetical protein